jgi:hypothetical protein
MENYHIITFLDSLSPKTLSLEEAMDLSRDRNELLLAPQLSSRGWTDPAPDRCFSENLEAPANEPTTSGSVARNSDH